MDIHLDRNKHDDAAEAIKNINQDNKVIKIIHKNKVYDYYTMPSGDIEYVTLLIIKYIFIEYVRHHETCSSPR